MKRHSRSGDRTRSHEFTATAARRKLGLALLLSTWMPLAGIAEPGPASFHVYAPSRESKSLLVVKAVPQGAKLELFEMMPTALGFAAATIAAHPDKPILYLSSNRSGKSGTPAATIGLARDGHGSVASVRRFTVAHGYSYLSLDRTSRFLLGCNYGDGFVDVHRLDPDGRPGECVASIDQGRRNAHCALVSPDNRSLYIPYVKESNALHQYHFDPANGALRPMEPLDAAPPDGTGPRHLVYHPKLPLLYFSNEQQLGVSIWERGRDGRLSLRAIRGPGGGAAARDGVTASDIEITPDGRFLFVGIRDQLGDANHLARYRVEADGDLVPLGLTPADRIPWGLALSPDGRFLLATSFAEGTLMAFHITAEGDLERVATLAWDGKISDLVAR